MKVAIPGEVVEAFIQVLQNASKLMANASRKFSCEAEVLDKKTDLSDEELNRGPALLKLEFENRERRAKVEALELDARELKAQADKTEAQVRQRSAQIRQSNLNRSTHKPKPPSGQQNRVQPAAQERRNAVDGGNEGKSLTHSLGDKLKAATPS